MDDCKPASELLAFFSPKGYKLFGTCFHTDGKTALESSETSSEHKSHKKGHDLKQDMTHLIFADIAMLRKSSLFIGMIQFNLVRVVHYLRYPHYQNTFNLVAKYNVSELSFFF